MEFNPIFYIDFYKVGHVDQYPDGTKQLWVNFTPRSTRVEGSKGVIFAGLQLFIEEVLINQFNRNFFQRPWDEIEQEYVSVIHNTLGLEHPRTDHIKALHELGRFPIDIYALPEGTFVPFGVPAMVLTNNDPRFFWLPNYLETMMSNYLWPVCTSATTAKDYRTIFLKAAKRANEQDYGFVDWMGHDFSYRGLMGTDAAILSGIGHLMSFNGTDTIPTILAANRYYNAGLNCGGSVPATEHSVMCAGGKDTEFETFKRLITKTYPTGIVSIVSDTWDLWKVLTNYVPRLKNEIHSRQGKVVIRPDSGDPVKILTGDPDAPFSSNERIGALRLLYEALGGVWDSKGGNKTKINNAGLIYGDSITKQRAEEILERADEQGFSPYNFVFGIGSYTYQYVTRDTYNFAFKATAVRRENGIVEEIFKDPVTDNAHKKSHRGIPVARRNRMGDLYVSETTYPEALDNCEFIKIFDGSIQISYGFDYVRKTVREQAAKEANI